MVLEKVKEYIQSSLVDEDTVTVLLVGSWTKEGEHDVNDIDLIIIKQLQLTELYNIQDKQDDFSLDIWVYDKDSLIRDLTSPAEDQAKVLSISMLLDALPDAKILFEKETFIAKYLDITKTWSWTSEYKTFFDYEGHEPSGDWEKKAYQENLRLLELCKNNIDNNNPATHRRKDYPELVTPQSEERAKKAMELTKKAYDKLAIEITWSEFRDAEKALATGSWDKCVASLKDVLVFMLRYNMHSTPEDLLDPSIWKDTEGMTLFPELDEAMKFIFQ